MSMVSSQQERITLTNPLATLLVLRSVLRKGTASDGHLVRLGEYN